MPHVVQQRSGQRVSGSLRGQALPEGKVLMQFAHARDESGHHEGGAHGVGKARVVCAWVGQARQSELANVAEALHLPRFEQFHQDGLFVRLEGDQAMHGVAKNHRQGDLPPPARGLKLCEPPCRKKYDNRR